MLKELQNKLTESGGQVMPANNVADAVVKQILCGRGNQIFMPHDAVLVSFIRVLPAWMQELLMVWGVGTC